VFEALEHNPHALMLHQAIWQLFTEIGLKPELIRRYMDLTDRSVFFSTRTSACVPLPQHRTALAVPALSEWNTFVEDRITPAQDPNEATA